MELEAETLVVGAGPAGLAVGACLRKRRESFTIVERETTVAASWRRHYERLHLHTDRDHSTLPYVPFSTGTPRYPSRDQVIAYLDSYAREFDLVPRFGTEVQSICSREKGWTTITTAGVYRSRNVVVATGYNSVPNVPQWPGQEIFGGSIVHSSEYFNGAPFRGLRVLVVGFGNSGGEIAIDLHEHGARVAMSVRGPVNIIPREILGLPAITIGIALSHLPNGLADILTAPLCRLLTGDIEKLGFRRLSMGPITQINTTAKVPLIDIGTLRLIRDGHVEVLGAVREMRHRSVTFEDGRSRSFDAVVLATGFRPGIGFLEAGNDAAGEERSSGASRGHDCGFHLCGFHVTTAGMLREIGIEAGRIAASIHRSK